MEGRDGVLNAGRVHVHNFEMEQSKLVNGLRARLKRHNRSF
jgi:hypothetical protein